MQPGRLGCPRQLKREFWRLIATGMQSDAASRTLGLTRTTGIRWFGEAGGVPPLDVADPSGRFLSISEREEIAVVRGHVSSREIARRLHRAPSTIVRELRRNTARDGQYRALLAQKHADHRSARPKPSKLAGNEQLSVYVQERLGGPERWSPEQISRRCRASSPTGKAPGHSRDHLPGPLRAGTRRTAPRTDPGVADRPGPAQTASPTRCPPAGLHRTW